ncbi:MAG: DMT family transporter [Leptospiraceae bacterium]|nr:DMT family transporter [Leptospiraceae bacterium]
MSQRLRAELVLVLCTLIWGGTFVATRFILADASALFVVTFRFGIGATVFLILFARPILRAHPGLALRGLVLGIVLLGAFYLQTEGLKSTTVARSAFLTQFLVIFTPALQFILWRRRPSVWTLAGIGVVLVGMLLLTWQPAHQPGATDGISLYGILLQLKFGDWITLLSAMFYSVYILLVDYFRADVDTFVLAFWQSLVVGLVGSLLIFLLEPGVVRPGCAGWLALAYLTLPGVVLVVFLHLRYQPRTTPARAALIFTLEPVFALLLAVIILHEQPPAISLMGVVLILAGILLGELPFLWSERGANAEQAKL